ncbi:sensor domain-containing diguanylate cyclase [Vreelandella zhaodongensis]|uniref:diguanylate cyclase n=1 Tax=Vreelandella zhaodongensis TaxID=1176240 RepID=A0ABX2SU90_VREZH|nr:sensor domain-containing diguanylate cyclase [Halomonas zhaodongensis]NYS45175.1 sensor domain-containing diguanylate cyclase [Halomonas zhaodongensis]
MGQLPPEQYGLYKTLLESTKAIPWKLNWITKEFEYIGPQIEALLGWRQDSWKTAQDWIDRIHRDEREDTANLCITQSDCGIDHEADYRALTASGGYVWVRDVVHVIREDGVTTALVGFIFDISERKKMEDVLLRLNKQLAALSFHDGLTGIANRRMYDRSIQVAWAQAQNNRTPLSLAILDVDHFKHYNDKNGHAAGDECLCQVANALNNCAAMRPTDMIARYGGEEFVLILPNTGPEEAVDIAETFRRLVANQRIPHPGVGVADVVTVSVGLNTIIPGEEDSLQAFFEVADRMLYRAKSNGRNRVECAGSKRIFAIN